MTGFDPRALISSRSAAIDVSGIRRAFELGATLENPINLSIGQPDFPVPDLVKDAAIAAIREDRNGYSLTQGLADLRNVIAQRLHTEFGWTLGASGAAAGAAGSPALDALVTSGTSGGLMLAFLAVLNPGDEVVIPDPWFVVYPALAAMVGAKAVACDTYPDFRMTAERVEPLLTGRTRMVVCNSPGNPSGVVMTGQELGDLADLCRSRGVLLVSDEIYDAFTFPDAREHGRCPSPASRTSELLLVRGFGKSYGCTGWRLGYAAGPTELIREMAKLQQYTFVCAPTPLQAGAAKAFDVDLEPVIARYAARRDRLIAALGGLTEISRPGGAFYAFVRIPEHLGMSGTAFSEAAIRHRLIVIPGGVFSCRDTHIRISYAVRDELLDEGLSVLASMMRRD